MNKYKLKREVNEMKNKNLLVAILVICVGVGGFSAGMKYQQSKQPSKVDFQTMRGMRKPGSMSAGIPGGGQRENSKMIKGEIIDQGEEDITIKLPDDSSKIILISENTKINKTTEGSVDDLETGKQIVVFGQENSDKSISASNIQLGGGFIRGNKPN